MWTCVTNSIFTGIFWLLLELILIMEYFSLEEDDGDNIFLTQTPSNLVPLIPTFDVETDMDMGAQGDTQNQGLCNTQYSDISSDDDGVFQCSQVTGRTRNNRLVGCKKIVEIF